MAEMTIATANIYWYGLDRSTGGGPTDVHHVHSPLDDERLVTMLSRLGGDLLCFQEIVDVRRFEAVLARANPRLSLRDPAGQVVCSRPLPASPDNQLRVVLAWNAEQLELLAWQTLALEPKWSRRPVFATFRHRGSGLRLEVLGVHARSTEPDAPGEAGDKKRREFAALAQWVDRATQAGQLHEALMLGDFNSKARGIDADALRTGALASWAWDEASGDPGSRWTTLVDRAVIDHILVSPALAPHIATTPEIVYFDRDPEVPEPPITQVSSGVLKNLTDHRPVRMALDLEP